MLDLLLKPLDGVAGVLKDPTSSAPVRIGGGTCVFSPKLKSVIPFDRMLLMIAELGGVSLERSKRLRAAPLKPADTSSVTSMAISGFWCRIIFGFGLTCRDLQKAAGVICWNHEGLRRPAQDLSRRLLVPALGVTPHVMKGESFAISSQKLGHEMTLQVACKSDRKAPSSWHCAQMGS